MSAFDKIKTGLEEAISYEKGELKANKKTITIVPVDKFAPEEIKSIRTETGMTQAVFARYLGVSVKTVEAWESGRNHPEGSACRMLALTKANPSFPVSSGIVAVD
ncbi:MAG: helix-turn-helix domain-containing protein [Clostridia bacterium]|nr:helix-turn-helix domain-containing protein [Clostridia bacterium]